MTLDAPTIIVFAIWMMTFVIYQGVLHYFKERRERREREQRDAEDRRRQAIIDEEYTRRNLYALAMARIALVRFQNRRKIETVEHVNWKDEGF